MSICPVCKRSCYQVTGDKFSLPCWPRTTDSALKVEAYGSIINGKTTIVFVDAEVADPIDPRRI